MRRPKPMLSALIAVVLVGTVLAETSMADRGDFVGSAACGKCHSRELAVWRGGPHAQAGKSLGTGKASACVGCHTTGDGPAGQVAERAVGCEACHGPGRGYAVADIMANSKLAQALGLRPLSGLERRKALCSSCHRVRTKLEALDLEREWLRIGHGGRK